MLGHHATGPAEVYKPRILALVGTKMVLVMAKLCNNCLKKKNWYNSEMVVFTKIVIIDYLNVKSSETMINMA